jgi:hypothetical protein
MDVAERFRGLVGGPAAGPAGDVEDMRRHVRAAYAHLCAANERGIQVPADVVAVVTAARKADAAELPDGLEARFWNAYGLLSSSIGPAARARRFYRWVFYLVLACLLLFQFVFTAGDHLRSRLAETEKQIAAMQARPVDGQPAAAAGTATAPGATAPAPSNAAGFAAERLEQSRIAYHKLSADVVAFASKPLHWIGGFSEFFDRRQELKERRGEDGDWTRRESEAHYTDVKARLELILAFLGTYLLPMLYGLLGACAFVLRQLSDEIGKLTYAHDARVRYALRLNIGLLCGLAVGWFVRPGGDNPLASLSPLALAFVAGYGCELFFVLLDRIVQAFAPAPGVASTTVHATTAGGITATETTTIQKVVASAEAAPPVSIPVAVPVTDGSLPPDGAQGDADRRARPAADAPVGKAA